MLKTTAAAFGGSSRFYGFAIVVFEDIILVLNKEIPFFRKNYKIFLQKIYFQSDSSSENISSTLFSNTEAIFSNNTAEGIYFSDSIALTVCLLTLTKSANSCCVIRFIARSTLILFFIIDNLFCSVNRNPESY